MKRLSPAMRTALAAMGRSAWVGRGDGEVPPRTAWALKQRGLVFSVGYNEFSLYPSSKVVRNRHAGRYVRATCACRNPITDGVCETCGAGFDLQGCAPPA